MKKIAFLVILMTFFLIFQGYGIETTRVAVLDFAAKGVDPVLAEAVVENLATSLIDSGCFEVIERSQLTKIMRELNLQNSDDFNDDLRQQLGNLYGVKLVILGSVTKIGDNITINARGIEVSTGVGKFGKRVYTDSENDIPSLISLLVDYIAETTVGYKKKSNNDDMEDFRDYAKRETDELKDERHEERRNDQNDNRRFTGQTVTLFNKEVPKMDYERFTVMPFEVDEFSGGNRDRMISELVFKAEDNCIDFKRIKIFFNDDEGPIVEKKISINKGDTLSIPTTDSNGNPRIFDEVVIRVTTDKCDGRQQARLIIYAIR